MSYLTFWIPFLFTRKVQAMAPPAKVRNSQSMFLTLQINDRLTPQAASVISLMQQLKGQQTCRAASPVGEIDRLGSVGNPCFYRILFPHIRVLNRDRRQRFSIPFCLDFKCDRSLLQKLSQENMITNTF